MAGNNIYKIEVAMPFPLSISTTPAIKPAGMRCCIYLLLLIASCCNNNTVTTAGNAEVVLICDNGTMTPAGSLSVHIDSVIAPVTAPYKGYSFRGWDISENIEIIGSKNNPQSRFRVKGTGTVTALFAPDTFTLLIRSSDSSHGRVDPSTELRKNCFDSISITATAEAGYSFIGWTITVGVDKVILNSLTAAQTMAKALYANATVQADFSPVQYAIATSVSPSATAGSVTSDPATSPQPFNTALRLTANANAGWKFDHWTGVPASQESNNPANVTVGTSNNFTAVFVPQTYTLYFVNYAGDTATTSKSSQSNITYGVATTIEANVMVNSLYSQKYEFKGVWVHDSGNVTFGSGNTVTLTSNAKIRPDLSKRQYTLGIVNPQPSGGSVTLVSPAVSDTYDFGTPIELSASALNGWQFVNWTATAGAIPTGPSTAGSAILSANTNYSAVFTKRSYTLTVSSPNANVSLNPPVPTFYYDSATTFSATVSGYNTAQYQFNNTWTVTNGSFNADYSKITLTGDAVATPVLSIRQYSYTLTTTPISGSGTVTVNQNSPQNYGTSLTFTATPETGWKVKSWGGGNIVATDTIHATATLTGTTAYNVEFERKSYSLSITAPSNGSIRDSVGNVMSGTYSFPFGFVVKVNAVADTGYQFGSWTGASGGVAGTITMDATKAVGVTFNPIPNAGSIIYVWKGAPAGGLKDGTSWLNAYTDLNTALTNAAINAEIWIAQGVYAPATSATFTPQEGTRIYGGFNGFEKLLSDRKFSEHFTELNGSGSSIIMQFGNIGISISGCVFKNALNNAIKISKGNCTVEDCIFRQNNETAILINGGLAIVRNTQIKRCGFHSNSGPASTAGKAISVGSLARTTLIQNSCFINNSGPAISDNNTSRAAATNDYTSITNCTIANNVSTNGEPGGIRSTGNTRLRGCILYYNDNSTDIGTQIDSTYIVDDCDVEYHATSRGVTKKDSMYWEPSNIDISPNFNFDFDSGTLPSDGQWFSTATDLPFIPRESTLYNADFTLEKSTDDFRRTARTATFDIGAYEKP